MEVNYRNIRNASTHKWYERALSEHLTMAISPYFSMLFIKWNLKPNTITVMMIVCGIMAPLLFMFDNIIAQCLSASLFLLWFTLDASDGEVARFTSTFSKHGRDLDYMSHISCHSLFVIAMWKIYAYQSEYLLPLTIFFFLLLATELFYRINVLYTVYVEKTEEVSDSSKKMMTCILKNIGYFPNFVVFFPLLYCVSCFLKINILPLFIALFFFYIVLNLRTYIRMIVRFYTA